MVRTSRNLLRAAAFVGGAWLGAGSADAALAQSWLGPLVTTIENDGGTCRGEVRSNGRFYRIEVFGLEPGGAAGLFIANEDIRPIDRVVRADANGRWAEFYVPFLAGRAGGLVQVAIEAPGCELHLSFPWRRPDPSIDARTERPLSRAAFVQAPN